MTILSIIVSVYNIQDYIARCLDSLLVQLDERIEVIVVDDGSTDESLRIIQTICESQPNVRIYSKENGGLSSARNFGLEKSTGQYVYFIDGDDFLLPDRLTGITDRLASSRGSFIAFDYKTLEEYHRKTKTKEKTKASFRQMTLLEYLKEKRSPITNVWKVMVRKDFLTENQIAFREDVLCEDIEWLISILCKLTHVICCDEALYVYDNSRSSSIMSQISAKRINDVEENIGRAKKQVDRIADTAVQSRLNFLLFREWSLNLASYSQLPKEERKSVEIHNPFKADTGHWVFGVFNFLSKVLSIRVIGHLLMHYKKTRKTFKNLLHIKKI